MTFSYDENIGDDVSEVRLILGDTDSTDVLLQDEEIDFFLTDEGSVEGAAARGAEAIAAKFSRRADVSIGDYSEKLNQVADHYFKLAEKIRKQESRMFAIPYAGGISKDDKETVRDNTDRVKPKFTKNIMQNPEVGRTANDTSDFNEDDS